MQSKLTNSCTFTIFYIHRWAISDVIIFILWKLHSVSVLFEVLLVLLCWICWTFIKYYKNLIKSYHIKINYVSAKLMMMIWELLINGFCLYALVLLSSDGYFKLSIAKKCSMHRKSHIIYTVRICKSCRIICHGLECH